MCFATMAFFQLEISAMFEPESFLQMEGSCCHASRSYGTFIEAKSSTRTLCTLGGNTHTDAKWCADRNSAERQSRNVAPTTTAQLNAA